MQKKVELLAPAGGYETMVGAFNAGADAVYLGGSKFGARAYADNFDTQQVLDAIRYAHLHGKRIYMTVNTLVKEREYGQVYDFMLPFAQNNLDGVIVQDYGVMRLIRDEFPNIELHASTQQTVTGVYGARLLKDFGCCRVVPARELSLSEMQAIREKADVEVEAFIHGAMCYCYSGACLFSSMVGGRSGNRGRCAQPCRLPYQMEGLKGNKEQYPLSLKDMCTIGIIPELIKAGIDSFKIEGRMKKPEYAAGVTALYRKYIDMYYTDPSKEIKVSDEDFEILKGLYQRTGISEGYYHKHNGREMVTISSPAYNGTSDKVLLEVKEKYLDRNLKIKCQLICNLELGGPLSLTMIVASDTGDIVENVEGNVVQAASKRPMDEDTVRKQLARLGNTSFETEEIIVNIDAKDSADGIFVPVSELNELRRELVEKVENRILDNFKEKTLTQSMNSYAKDCADSKGALLRDSVTSGTDLDKHKAENRKCPEYHVLVNTVDQLKAVFKALDKKDMLSRVYVDSNLFFNLTDDSVQRISETADQKHIEFLVALPYVCREESFDATEDIRKAADSYKQKGFLGLLVRNLEQLGFLEEIGFMGKVVPDYGVYAWNHGAAGFISDLDLQITELCVPYELTIHEAKELSFAVDKNIHSDLSYNVYGRVPMMVSAGCVKKTLDKCSGKLNTFNCEKMVLVDRMGNHLPVTTNCRNCYNVVWNAAPTSLHKKIENIKTSEAFDHFRIDFTVENEKECEVVLGAYLDGNDDYLAKLNSCDYTTGHFKRGVE